MASTPTVRVENVPKADSRRSLPVRVASALVLPYKMSHGVARVMLIVGTCMVAVVVLAAIFAPWLSPYGFDQVKVDGEQFEKQAPPSGEHVLGTNTMFYDVLSRIIWGAQTEITVVIFSLLFSVALGVVLGLVSGYIGGWLDRVLVLIMDALFAFPYLLLAIVVAFMLADKFASGVATAAFAITVVYIPQYFRVVRNGTVSAKEATYVEAARAIGAGPVTIMGRYLFTNVVQSVPVIATLNAADAILTLAGLGFLGIGIDPREASEWGYDLNRALGDASAGIWWTGVFPGLAIAWLVVGLTLVGEGLNETLNPTLRVRRLLPVNLPSRKRERSTADKPTEQPGPTEADSPEKGGANA